MKPLAGGSCEQPFVEAGRRAGWPSGLPTARRRASMGPGVSEWSSVGPTWWRGFDMGCYRAVWGPGTPGSPRGSPHSPRLRKRRLPWPLGVRGCEQALLLSTAAVCTPQPSMSGLAQAPALCWGPQGPRRALSEVGAEGTWGVEGMPGPALAQQGRTTGGWARGLGGWGAPPSPGAAAVARVSGRPRGSTRYARGSAGRVLGCAASPLILD